MFTSRFFDNYVIREAALCCPDNALGPSYSLPSSLNQPFDVAEPKPAVPWGLGSELLAFKECGHDAHCGPQMISVMQFPGQLLSRCYGCTASDILG